MDFWSYFKKESLYDPYVIRPPFTPENSDFIWPQTDFVFVFEQGSMSHLSEMAKKMKLALKLDDTKLSMIELNGHNIDKDQPSSSVQKILFFGHDFPGVMGEWIHWQGCHVIKTHSLFELDQNPDLKRETWQHLKLFVGAV